MLKEFLPDLKSTKISESTKTVKTLTHIISTILEKKNENTKKNEKIFRYVALSWFSDEKLVLLKLNE